MPLNAYACLVDSTGNATNINTDTGSLVTLTAASDGVASADQHGHRRHYAIGDGNHRRVDH